MVKTMGKDDTVKVTALDEMAIHDIGHTFGCCDYGQERGMTAAFFGKAAAEAYICAYVRGMLRDGKLYDLFVSVSGGSCARHHKTLL